MINHGYEHLMEKDHFQYHCFNWNNLPSFWPIVVTFLYFFFWNGNVSTYRPLYGVVEVGDLICPKVLELREDYISWHIRLYLEMAAFRFVRHAQEESVAKCMLPFHE